MEAGAELIARARLICGEQHVLTHPAVLSTYRSDGVRRDGPLPLAAILPASPSEVTHVVSACAATGVPFNVRGAGTSTDGGSLPAADGVLLVLTRMRRVLSVEDGEIAAEAGAPVSALVQLGAIAPRDGNERDGTGPLGTGPLGTIGGYVAQTSGLSNLSAIELVRPNGSLARLDWRQPGYDVIGAFPGSRGRAGIAVVISLRTESAR